MKAHLISSGHGHSSSCGGRGPFENDALYSLCGAFVADANYVLLICALTEGFLKQRLAQVTEPLITVIVLKQAFKILNSKINFLNISCQSL